MRRLRAALRLKLLAVVLGVVPAFTGALPGAAAAHVFRPQRIVSLDLCTDQLLVELVPRARIAAVTHLAADPTVSAIPEKARGIAITRGAAEDVLRYDPDLVLAGPYGVSTTVDLLRRLKRNVVIVPLADDLDQIRASVRAVAAAVGEDARGEALIAAYDRRRAQLSRAKGAARPPTALVYQVSGAVSGPGSLADAMLAAAGLRNMSQTYRLTRQGQVPLELLLARPPDLLILSNAPDDFRVAIADNLRHPVIGILRRRGLSLDLPWRMWLCGTPHVLDAVEQLAAARAALEAGRQ